MEEYINQLYINKNKLDYECGMFVNIHFDTDTLFKNNSKFNLLVVDNIDELKKTIYFANRTSVLESISKIITNKIIIINSLVFNEKGFNSILDDFLKNKMNRKVIPIIIKVKSIYDINDIFLKKCKIIINDVIKLKTKKKINRKIIHKYREYMVGLNYTEAFVKIKFINEQNKYLL